MALSLSKAGRSDNAIQDAHVVHTRIGVIDQDAAAGQALAFFLSTTDSEIRYFGDLLAFRDDPCATRL